MELNVIFRPKTTTTVLVYGADGDALRRCPKCNMRLWPKTKVRQRGFHDLRHTTASLLMQAGANTAAVQRILRHSEPRLTTETYGHLSPEYLRAEVDRLSFAPKAQAPAERSEQPLAVAANGSLATISLPGNAQPESKSAPAAKNLRDSASENGGRRGFRPPDPLRVNPSAEDSVCVVGVSKPLQTLGSPLAGDSSESQDFARFSQNLTTSSLPNFSDAYLTVREAAALFKVSTETIYRLCETGALVSVRVSNVIRIPRRTLRF